MLLKIIDAAERQEAPPGGIGQIRLGVSPLAAERFAEGVAQLRRDMGQGDKMSMWAEPLYRLSPYNRDDRTLT